MPKQVRLRWLFSLGAITLFASHSTRGIVAQSIYHTDKLRCIQSNTERTSSIWPIEIVFVEKGEVLVVQANGLRVSGKVINGNTSKMVVKTQQAQPTTDTHIETVYELDKKNGDIRRVSKTGVTGIRGRVNGIAATNRSYGKCELPPTSLP